MNRAKKQTLVALCCTFIIVAFFSACENDLNKVKEISAEENGKTVETTTGVDIIYSDSARVKAHVLTPLMLHFNVNTTNPYYEMPKGVKIVVYDAKLRPNLTITSNYAITSNNDNVIELRKNVVLTDEVGDTFKSEELVWDRTKKLYYSNQTVYIDKPDGTHLTGANFKSSENIFTDYTMTHGKGDIVTNGSLAK